MKVREIAAVLLASMAACSDEAARAPAPPTASGAPVLLAGAVDRLELATVHATSALSVPADLALAEASADLVLELAPAASPDEAARASRALVAWISALAATAPVGSGAVRVARASDLAARLAANPALAPAATTMLAAREAAHATLAARIEALAAAALDAGDYDRLTRLDGLLGALADGAPGAPSGGEVRARSLRAHLRALRASIYGPGEAPIRLGIETLVARPDRSGVDVTVWLRRDEAPGLPPLMVDPRAIRLVAVGGVLEPLLAATPARGDLTGGSLAPQGELSGRLAFPLPAGGIAALRSLVYTPPGGRPPVERAIPASAGDPAGPR